MADFWQMVEFSHLLMSRHISAGAVVIDATAGNGHDSLMLANLVGDEGRVYPLISGRLSVIQKNSWQSIGFAQGEAIQDGHQNLDKYIIEEIDGMIFNLGYLPGGDKEIITNKETTIEALEKGLELLRGRPDYISCLYRAFGRRGRACCPA